jgi:hypothetical protein
MRWPGCASHTGELGNSYSIFIDIAEGKKPLGRLRQIWKDTVKMHSKKIR